MNLNFLQLLYLINSMLMKGMIIVILHTSKVSYTYILANDYHFSSSSRAKPFFEIQNKMTGSFQNFNSNHDCVSLFIAKSTFKLRSLESLSSKIHPSSQTHWLSCMRVKSSLSGCVRLFEETQMPFANHVSMVIQFLSIHAKRFLTFQDSLFKYLYGQGLWLTFLIASFICLNSNKVRNIQRNVLFLEILWQ